jgi:hypothetical protein
MILPASYSNGFAPRDGQPLYPELWCGCVGAWNPGLGPSGLTLRDWSGFSKHGTLTNMDPVTGWSADQGRYALSFDGSNDHVSLGSSAILDGSDRATISVFINLTTVGGGHRAIFYASNQFSSNNVILQTNDIDNAVRFYINPVLVQTTQLLPINNWTHVAGTYDGAVMTIYLNGVAVNSGIKTGNITDSGVLKNLGSYAGYPHQFFPGSIEDCRLYKRSLSPNEIRTLASRRGIAYELAPRRRSSSAVQFNLNRRRRLLLGAQS